MDVNGQNLSTLHGVVFKFFCPPRGTPFIEENGGCPLRNFTSEPDVPKADHARRLQTGDRDVAYCKHFRSYNPRSRTYVGYNGDRRECY